MVFVSLEIYLENFNGEEKKHIFCEEENCLSNEKETKENITRIVNTVLVIEVASVINLSRVHCKFVCDSLSSRQLILY